MHNLMRMTMSVLQGFISSSSRIHNNNKQQATKPCSKLSSISIGSRNSCSAESVIALQLKNLCKTTSTMNCVQQIGFYKKNFFSNV